MCRQIQDTKLNSERYERGLGCPIKVGKNVVSTEFCSPRNQAASPEEPTQHVGSDKGGVVRQLSRSRRRSWRRGSQQGRKRLRLYHVPQTCTLNGTVGCYE